MNIIVKTIAGSHLFGTNTPTSDKDYKGIYLPTSNDILLNKIQKTIKENTNNTGLKNTSEDVDMEYYSLCHFLKLVEKGETVALELLFTPKELVLESSEIWEEIQLIKHQWLHSGTLAFIGYARTQANKYGIKGSRMGAIKSVLELIKDWNPDRKILHDKEELEKVIDNHLVKWTWIQFGLNANKTIYFEVCGRKFDLTTKLGYMRDALVRIYQEYGHRAQMAEKNEGVDWKAVSHAFRVCRQGKELFSTGTLTLPLKKEDRDFIVDVKLGRISMIECGKILDQELTELELVSKSSLLPSEPDKESLNKFLKHHYGQVVHYSYLDNLIQSYNYNRNNI